MLDPKSDILSALYRMQREEAQARADSAAALTVWEAAALGRTEALERLLAGEPALANAFGADGNTPLGLACFFGAPAAVRTLLQHGALVNVAAKNEMQVQPLHAAVSGRNAEAVAMLLEQGADVNARQQVGYSPLMGAAGAGQDDIADLLLARGADPSLTSDDGKTAATIAADHGHHALAERLQGTRA